MCHDETGTLDQLSMPSREILMFYTTESWGNGLDVSNIGDTAGLSSSYVHH